MPIIRSRKASVAGTEETIQTFKMLKNMTTAQKPGTRGAAALYRLSPVLLLAILFFWPGLRTGAEEEGAPVSITVEPGFHVDVIRSAAPDEGSWICMAADAQGRMTISSQSPPYLLRVTVTNGQAATVEQLSVGVTSAMGLCYSGNSLFMDGLGPFGWGIYRIDMNDDQFGPLMLLRPMNNNSEHGSHEVVVGPDHKLYVVSGDWTLPGDVAATSPYRNYGDDQLLARDPDSSGFSAGSVPPEGFVLRMDLDGGNCELFGGGSRNNYCIDFNSEGELFGFENDWENEYGVPWYRPCRILHWVSGGDYGHRQGTGKFPEYYEDTLPSVVHIGLGAPTGVKFPPANCAFPPSYRSACFVEDWTFGRIMAIHLTPHGASYDGTVETILRGVPLNLTSLQFGNDGALYFITGGRKLHSSLYRLGYIGDTNVSPKFSQGVWDPDSHLPADKEGAQARQLRHQLEALHGKAQPGAVDFIWPHLSSPDRWIRFAARVALESQDVALWKDRALAETQVDGGLTAIMALARYGGTPSENDCLKALDKFPYAQLDREQLLLKLRVLELIFIRQGPPADDMASHEAGEIDALYPADNEDANHELCELLLYLKAPDAVGKTMKLLESAVTQEDQIYYVMRLRNIAEGWTLEDRRAYLGWFDKKRDNLPHPAEVEQSFKEVGRPYNDGPNVQPFLNNFRQESIMTVAAGPQKDLADVAPLAPPPAPTPTPAVPTGLKIVKYWTWDDLAPNLGELKSGRSFEQGQAAFAKAQCVLCHRFGNSGGNVGPELTAVSSRLTAHDILESIVFPSKVVPDQYKNTIVNLTDGDVLTGRIMEEDAEKIVLMTDMIHGVKVDVKKSNIESRRLSNISPMPEGLLNCLTAGEIWDLISYLQSGGVPTSSSFKR